MAKRSGFETFFYVISKIFLAITFLPLAFLLGIGALISILIDKISKKEDEQHLSYSETKKRDTDRKNARRHWYLNFILDYFKLLFS